MLMSMFYSQSKSLESTEYEVSVLFCFVFFSFDLFVQNRVRFALFVSSWCSILFERRSDVRLFVFHPVQRCFAVADWVFHEFQPAGKVSHHVHHLHVSENARSGLFMSF